jgi:hypothetical protein
MNMQERGGGLQIERVHGVACVAMSFSDLDKLR